ncbi:unnamed protein product [Pocillopora meandrina]|uniref:Uncharacterized protein n=1 Tax=Pocillopora meandrina TaxID=46732 RepID=A0AAU9WX19_9CNID|nr:unnamed protein product [Pocillopora meandrina]
MADCKSNHCREKQRKENFQRKESVGNENEFKDVMTERLWNIATSRLDVKQHDGRGQETNPSEELSGSCFDDLSGEISIYEDFKSKENCFTGSERGKTGPSTWDKDNNSSFEMLADVQWN